MKYQVKITKQRPQDWHQIGDVYEFQTLEEAEKFRDDMRAKGKHTENIVKVEYMDERRRLYFHKEYTKFSSVQEEK